MKKKILLVCYHFPPNVGIGGRKWSFLTKYLLKKEIEIHVLTRYPARKQFSLWQEMTEGVHLHFFKSNYPRILEEYPKNNWGKALYKIYIFLFKIITNSNYNDRGLLLKKSLLKQINETIKKYNITNVVVTGAPFSFLYYGSMIKEQHKHINYIADIRDSWIKGNYFGFDALSERRKTEETNRLKKVINIADHIFVPYPILVNEYTSIGKKNNVALLPHAIDLDYVKPRAAAPEDKCILVNFGSQYAELYDTMKLISTGIKETSINIEFYTDDRKYEDCFSSNTSNIDFMPPIKYSDMFEVLSVSTAALLFVNRHIKDFLSTKYIESIAARIPIVLIGYKGFVSEFIENNRLGIFIEDIKVQSEFAKIPERLKKLDYNNQFDVTPFTFEGQAEEIIKLLN